MVENGMGIGIMSIWNASESLKSECLVEVLPNVPLVTESSIWALYPSARIVAPKVRAMIDFLLDRSSPIPPWER
jgi:DNA-binding transcriptional LysR family regulator